MQRAIEVKVDKCEFNGVKTCIIDLIGIYL
jgi:hypothetical protein